MTVTAHRHPRTGRRTGTHTPPMNPRCRYITIGTELVTREPSTLELSVRTPHILITGDRLSGKTAAFNTIARQLRGEMSLMIAAPHATSAPLGAINAHPTINSLHRLSAPWAKDAVKQWCSAVYAELDTRLATNVRRRTVAVMIDDLADLAHIYPPVYDVVEQVCLDGPSVGMHMITSATTAATMRQDWALCGLHRGYRLVGRCNMADSRQLLAGHEVSAPTTAAQPTMHLLRLGKLRAPEPVAIAHRPQAASDPSDALKKKECS